VGIEQLNGSQAKILHLAVFSAFVDATGPASELTSTPLAVFAPTNRRDGGWTEDYVVMLRSDRQNCSKFKMLIKNGAIWHISLCGTYNEGISIGLIVTVLEAKDIASFWY
jgi:hypothetical protein